MNNSSSDIYSLQDTINYKCELLYSTCDIFKTYTRILNCYIENYIKSSYTSTFYVKNIQFYYYLLDKGVSTINHVFNILLYYTKNIELVEHYCLKVIHYYIEFIGQNIEQDEKKIDYNNASLFSYVKTICKLNRSYIKTSIDKVQGDIFESINIILTVFQQILNRHLNSIEQCQQEQLSKSIENNNKKYIIYILELFENDITTHIKSMEELRKYTNA